ncbi:MAG: 50S ribosomal protein L20 [Candidatus Phytoplasma vitis]|nr:MAG: 50S ribosomal protein L20 [Candidatus Phytoplasma vitis]
MVKVNFVTARHKRRKKILKLAKGYFGSKSVLYKTAHEQVMRSLQYAYRDRRQKKRNLRKLWITRISAGCLNNDIRYSQFMHGLLLSKIEINRKILADIVHNEPQMFSNYVDLSKKALENKKNIKKIELQKQEEKNKQEKLKEIELQKQEEKNKQEKLKEIELQKQEELKETKFENEKNINQEKQKKELDLNSKLLPELKKLAKKYKIQNVSKLKKVDLINLLEEKIEEKNKQK